jgi:hypothetical protein
MYLTTTGAVLDFDMGQKLDNFQMDKIKKKFFNINIVNFFAKNIHNYKSIS